MSDSEEILSILNDEISRKIIKKITGDELTIQQISTFLDIPQSTAYRKIRKLEEMGLIKKTKVVRNEDGSDESYYKSWIYQIGVTFKNGELSYSVEKFKMEDKIVRLWEKFSNK
ncbi:MAG TPA: helix-turn-helix domain-containing protein [Nitrosopumilaceae archaeon]|nr:helix-turn-helix domain-containing protein [Nitrosopumilaceae archaeon]